MKFWHVLVIAVLMGIVEGTLRHYGVEQAITGICDWICGAAAGVWACGGWKNE